MYKQQLIAFDILVGIGIVRAACIVGDQLCSFMLMFIHNRFVTNELLVSLMRYIAFRVVETSNLDCFYK